ncbi:unnamed protein product [Gemmata massiliana]|uniref:Secreted protein n=1 Tax=Gemmata massiliana TaxID=1210884 RepID=A0A6P2CTQ3_9BACT|nr:unnamed protein product [Gemmata massiliana]
MAKLFSNLSRLFGAGFIAAVVAATATKAVADPVSTDPPSTGVACWPGDGTSCNDGYCLFDTCRAVQKGFPPYGYCCY